MESIIGFIANVTGFGRDTISGLVGTAIATVLVVGVLCAAMAVFRRAAR